ncbi:carbon-nitrogen hydrolase family protein [Mesorhizobium sp.]|uniref:carbon-nitrogen hydrolase family protein n=1 Tax=Mesorhizobium sp. TaxID=1871066 RepID=UPI0012131FB5|nr:carbon-nitrogen hydrolase family protein [Mesorhizobium sp.]TIO06087.1 MAG: carbon-nitrogen hydrolase family protein [Mesorhizobium sp.]TIO31648.1 MAG: carbon-nitrogen hydrolase family protein [Mesorhizobium sp.]TIP09803.1 MAG: carbon-nitrogen hydrolase family protein [Mesorhizobium sp.]
MTKNGTFKHRVRTRAAKTGESYTAALMHVRGSSRHDLPAEAKSVRLAVAQSSLCDDPRDIAALRAGGLEMRRLMRQAHQAGARIVHFPEGATCSPNKRIMSVSGPEEVGPSAWGRFEWAVLREELNAARELARELGLWTVFGSVHQLTQPHRPHNSLYIVSDLGKLVTRYDERMLSNTKISFMYTPGSIPVTFEVDGVRFGCALGMETHFPEIFIEYERLDVDCVLFSTTGGASPNELAFASETQGHAASNSYWISFSMLARHGMNAPSGIVAPDGRWAAQCAADGMPSIAVVDINNNPGDLARPWRRTARTGIYEWHLVDDDPRSDSRDIF